MNLLERTAVNVAVDAVKDHWREWVAKAGEFLSDESDAIGTSAQPPKQGTVVERFAAQMHEAMREGGGDPHMSDGMSWWERSVTVLSAARDQVADLVRGVWEGLVDRFRSPNGTPGNKQDGIER